MGEIIRAQLRNTVQNGRVYDTYRKILKRQCKKVAKELKEKPKRFQKSNQNFKIKISTLEAVKP